MMKLVLITLCVLCLVPESVGWPDGAPPGACTTLTPSHGSGIVAQTTAPPFTVTAGSSTYTTGSKINVTLKAICGETFRGFILQARRADQNANRDEPIGTFNTVSNSKHVGCTGATQAAVTHNDRSDKTEMVFEWTAPATVTGHIVFVATFVKVQVILWTTVYSDVTMQVGDGSTVDAGGKIYPTVSNTCNESVTSDPPTVAPASGSVTYDSDCGNTKGCFTKCTGTQCEFLVTWKPDPQQIEFTLAAAVNADTDKWLALGFSTDTGMGDDSVIECAAMSSDIGVYSSYNTGQSNARLSDPSVGVTKVAGTIIDGVMRCTILRNVSVAGNDKIYDLNNKYYMLFAMGDTQGSSNDKTPHSFSSLPAVSSKQLGPQSTEVDGASAAGNQMIKAHGSLMISAWVLAASFGIVVARYFKQLGGQKHKACGEKIWFQIHRFSMILTFLCAAAAFIIIFVDVEGYSMVGKPGRGEPSYLQAHPILGIISTALVLLNPLMALIRPHPDTTYRPVFNWAHWGVGTIAWIVSIITIFFGFEIGKSGVHYATKYVMAAFVAYQLVMEILLEIVTCLNKNSGRAGDYEMKKMGEKETETSGHSYSRGDPGAGTMKVILLVVHFVMLVAFTIALLVLVNNVF